LAAGRELLVPQPQQELHRQPRHQLHLVAHIAPVQGLGGHLLHNGPQQLRLPAVGEGEALDAPAGELLEVDLPPGELPVGQVLPGGHGAPAVQQVAQQQDPLRVAQGPGPRHGEVRVADGKGLPQQGHGDGFRLLIPGQGAPGRHLRRVPGLKSLHIELQRELLFVVLAVDRFHRRVLVFSDMGYCLINSGVRQGGATANAAPYRSRGPRSRTLLMKRKYTATLTAGATMSEIASAQKAYRASRNTGMMKSARKYTSLRKKDREKAMRTWPMAVKPSTISYWTPRGIMAAVHTRMAHRDRSATSPSPLNRATNRGPATRASRNSRAV